MLFLLNKKQWALFYAGAAFVLLLLGILFSHPPDKVRVTVFDVGQGDAILLQTPQGRNVLIDAGPDSSAVGQLGKRMGFFDKTIDLFVLTHPHYDHVGGFMDVARQYTIRHILLTGVASDDLLYKEFLNFVKDKKIPVAFARSDQDWKIAPDFYLDVLYPLAGQSLVGQRVQDPNNTSIVMRVARAPGGAGGRIAPLDKGGGRRPGDLGKGPRLQAIAILTGDAGQEEERAILDSGQDVRSDLLKVGHHGSRTATSEAFLSAVRPREAVISYGKDNKFGHPAPETLNKLSGIKVWRTAEDGDAAWEF